MREGDFGKSLNLAASAGDFVDADNIAATSCAVVGAMHGMKALPADLVKQLGDRDRRGETWEALKLTPPVDESISELARRTAAVGHADAGGQWGRGDGRNGFDSVPGGGHSAAPAVSAGRFHAELEPRLDARAGRIRRRRWRDARTSAGRRIWRGKRWRRIPATRSADWCCAAWSRPRPARL